MAGKLIAHLVAWYMSDKSPGGGGLENLTVDSAYLLEAQRLHAELERRARGQPLCVEVDIRPVKNKRTLDQNRLMWARSFLKIRSRSLKRRKNWRLKKR